MPQPDSEKTCHIAAITGENTIKFLRAMNRKLKDSIM